MIGRAISLILLAAGSFLGASAQAQTTAGAGSVVMLPTVANIAVYSTEVFVRNPNSSLLTLNVRYYQSNNGTPPAGLRSCQQLFVQPSRTTSFDLAGQCGLNNTDDNFGMIILEDAAAEKIDTFFAYSRTQTPTGIGFSVEGFPVGNFSGAPANAPATVLGLRKLAAAPNYRSNCFIAALGEPVTYQLRLFQDDTGVPIGGQITGSLGAYETTRFLDVFAQAGVASGDFSNVRASFTSTTTSSFAAFCTLETSSNGSADFRIAKSIDSRDNRQSRLTCYGQDDCNAGTPSTIDPPHIDTGTQRNVHYLILDQPDYVKCNLVPAGVSLQIQLRQPGDSLASPPFPGGGGAGQTSFYIYTGERSTIASGTTTRWYIDVTAQSGASGFPIDYGITCRSGNGTTVPWLGTTVP